MRAASLRTLAVPVGLFLIALAVRAVAATAVPFAASEDSAYYVAVAHNLLDGRGLVSDAIWSYATPPLTLPKPAFELWMPMATFVSAVPMAIAGATLAAAQAGAVVLGAFIAPLVWLVGREAATEAALPARRAATVALTAGLLAAVLGPFLVAAATPDSTTPFLVFGTLAAVLMPRALRGAAAASGRVPDRGAPATPAARRWLPGLAVGVSLGLAYLSRSESIWLGLAYLLLVVRVRRTTGIAWAPALGPVVIGGLIVVVPWLVRNILTFGSPFAGQALENAFLVRNDDVFAWAQRPGLSTFLGQGIGQIVGHQVEAVVHQAVNVLVIPAFPVGIVGLIAAVALRRSPALRRPTALRALLIGGGLIFVATALLFPVATLWGTFLHASGPLLCGLCVTAALGADAVVARVGRARAWSRENAWFAAAALLALAIPLAGLEVTVLSRQAAAQQARLQGVAAAVSRLPDVRAGAAVITDHPVWLAEALGVPAIALPDEPPSDLVRLADAFGATVIVVLDQRGRYPAALISGPDRPCTFGPPIPVGPANDPAWVIRIVPECSA
ncbi:MAG: 4-amino-4-deoxy-L-arabinose transferase [Chloroflexota bacterium]|nr:4-amino-4-deoxy-L-arabinose transferase [Chloroflexota bacterium]